MDPEIENTALLGDAATETGGTRAFFLDLVKFTILALVIVAPIRWFVAQPFIVNGASMDPTFRDGDYLIVDQLSYYFEEPARGDVVIFKYPKDPSKYFIKRVIGLPQEKIHITDGQVTITTAAKETIVLTEPYLVYEKSMNTQTGLGPNEYFVLGDNRPASSDSRVWGPVPRKLITGSVFVRLYPFNQIGVRPGYVTE